MKRIASISIIVEETESTSEVNKILHGFADIIEGRMGLPLKQYGVAVITLCVVGDDSKISALSGALGRVKGVSVKASYSKKEITEE